MTAHDRDDVTGSESADGSPRKRLRPPSVDSGGYTLRPRAASRDMPPLNKSYRDAAERRGAAQRSAADANQEPVPTRDQRA